MRDKRDEMESLNVDDLDIEELEHRLDLASALPIISDGWQCGTHFTCRTNSSEDYLV